ncbi:16S rRNA (guanine(527)-N(7))-methyltransferase RsmG [candidate division WOR-1 bacterium RIFCSPHIGHO2_01_FULL_53_15]|uniref:Ribosomal RNA small subunit methyltransferase G n=1 Tax=candidate division WOR-1 bacterium RIFCSPHIGHO2_01_FULL_53_15 TaxID=1802564 RepID=A0A1F4Q0V4_UNCSA|nr:MAG: 16S rRNA (guanine(527)-N(7))-methyltransferase RsmG [candidate division WOR-1 bacterium RIFCSPHIGHO2_01_FULL_53_15]OGC10747.1 MAG: 16S rRNA (guanine(527)-N(7))-methyltransferase RsmG [candidate division WOR-1 bacterium RIFCSPHIGHO2_02_FULL_53_26]
MDKLFNLYLQELIEWNKKFNLTAVTDPAEIRVRHFEDSLSVLEAIDLSDQRVVDIGPGAGFPGLPLKIVRPGIKLTLVEATRKKIEFLRHLVEVLNLADVEIIWGRAEEVQKDKRYAGQFDVALARAVAKLPILVKYALPFLKPGGLFVAQKQAEVRSELGGLPAEVKTVKVGGALRSLVVIRKT